MKYQPSVMLLSITLKKSTTKEYEDQHDKNDIFCSYKLIPALQDFDSAHCMTSMDMSSTISSNTPYKK